jgi:hypothetical protein
LEKWYSVARPATNEVILMATRAFGNPGRGIASAGLARDSLATRAARGVEARELFRRAAAAALFAAMAAGSVALWAAVPVGVLWLVSQLSASLTPSAGIVVAVAVAIPAAVVLGAQVLVRVERAYMRVTDTAPSASRVHGWRRSLSDSSASGPATVLEKMMLASVLLALVAFVVWFFAFAGSSLPT